MMHITKVVVATAILAFCNSCASRSKVFAPTSDDAGSSRVAEVVQVASRAEITGLGVHYQHLLSCGIEDSNIRDGSLVVARVYCCGGAIETTSAPWIFVPTDLVVETGDIIEVKMGKAPSKNQKGAVNTALRVRHHGISNSPCRWIPERDGLWMRVLYCDWMQEEGWVERTGLYNTWIKRNISNVAQ